MMRAIDRLEKDSILFYQGGGKRVKLSSDDQGLREFYDAKDPYMVMNALLMPGISNERARLVGEKKRFDPVMLDHMEELIEVYCRLYCAMCKYTAYYERESRHYTYRCDRMNTLEFLKHGQMPSFMSTAVENDGNPYFHDKEGILLLEVDAPGDIEHVDVNAVLEDESEYPNENEILYAPFALLERESMEMTEEEKAYRDRNGEAPKAKYLLHLKLSLIVPQKPERNCEKLKKLYGYITDASALSSAKEVWMALMSGKTPAGETAECYTEWKEKLQLYLRLRFAEIKWKNSADKHSLDELLRQEKTAL